MFEGLEVEELAAVVEGDGFHVAQRAGEFAFEGVEHELDLLLAAARDSADDLAARHAFGEDEQAGGGSAGAADDEVAFEVAYSERSLATWGRFEMGLPRALWQDMRGGCLTGTCVLL